MRRLETLVEFTGMDQRTQDLLFNDLYEWDPKTDTFMQNGRSFILEDIMFKLNWDEERLRLELENRKKLLNHMVEEDMDEYDIISLIQSYYVDPQKTMQAIGEEVAEDDEPTS